MTVEQELAAWAAGSSPAVLSDSVVDAVRKELIWTLGSMLAGSRDVGSDRVLRVCDALTGKSDHGPCTAIGGGTRFTPDVAGFANGVFAKALEYEDKHWIGNSYAYAVAVAVVPAVLAMAQHLGVTSDSEILTAIAVATDIEMRLISGAPRAIDTHFNATYMFGHFGAVVAAGKIARLSEEEMLNALGLAFEQAAGSNQPRLEGSLGVRMQMGFCVRNGIYAAAMAAEGITAPRHFLGGHSGLYAAFFDQYLVEEVNRDLGTSLLTTRLGYKGYPCCAAGHQGIEAVRLAAAARDFDPTDIAEIHVEGAPSMFVVVEPRDSRWHPTNHVEQSFSLPWAVACLLYDGELTLGHFREEALESSHYMELAAKVSATLDRRDSPVTARITLNDGRMFDSPPVGPPLGHPDNPLSWDDIIRRTDDILASSPWLTSDASRLMTNFGSMRGLPTDDTASDILECLKALG